MPMYKWTCDECNTEVELIKRASEYEEPPSVEECGSSCVGEGTKHKWKRILSGAPSWVRGDSWRGGKGYW